MNTSIEKIRHSLAHIMAYAVKELYGNVKMGVGPTTDSGFYYDLDLEHKIIPEDLKVIENKMRELLKSDIEFKQVSVTEEEARSLFKDDPYKKELIDEITQRGEDITLYQSGDFIDLCRGPHVGHVKEIPSKAFKLNSIAGAYWRGNEKNPILQRVYGLAFEHPLELKEYAQLLEEVKKRDHRKLGKELDLFSLHDEAGAGLIYWHPKGGRIRVAIEDFWRREHLKNGYEIIFTPHIGKAWLWETSGHLDFYKEGMFSPMDIDGSDYYAKPMNCPFHIMVYQSNKHSYRDLPYRWAELGTVYRYERSGTMHGTMRVRGFTQDDAHIICTPDQIGDEIVEVLQFSVKMLNNFGFTNIQAYLSTQPEKSVGEESRWKVAQEALEKALIQEKIEYDIDEGGGAFYGPKIDLKVQDAMKREWQLSTIQFDFNLPERFNMTFTDSEGKEVRPFMVHRALLGSIERFFGVLIEHYNGAFPLWLSPVEVAIVPIREEHLETARDIANRLIDHDIRIKLYERDENMNQKIKKAQKEKTPVIAIIGDKEVNDNVVSIRLRGNKILQDVPLNLFIDDIIDYHQTKKIDLDTIFNEN